MRGFFTFPNKQKIRNFQLNPFVTSKLVPRPKPKKVKRHAEGGEIISIDGIQLPTEPVPMDLEMNDLMYDLDEPEDKSDEEVNESAGEDEYENSILKDPITNLRPVSAETRTAAQSRTVATPTTTPARRRVTPSRKSKKRKLEEEEEEESEEQSFGEGSLAHQQWMREQHEFDRKGVQQQFLTSQQQQQHHHQQHGYNLYANPQPGPSAGARSQPGASMPDVYLGPDSLKSFDSYYF